MSELRGHLEALEMAREFLLREIEAGAAKRINHNDVRALDTVIEHVVIEVGKREENSL